MNSESIYQKYKKNGFCVIDFCSKKDLEKYQKLIIKRLNKTVNIYNLNNFHKYCINNKLHSKIINPSKRYINFEQKNFSKKFKKFLNIFTKKIWNNSKYEILWVGSLKKNEIKKNKAGFRIVRPKTQKESGIEHTDAYSRNINSFLTIWVPLVGFNKNYTLRYAKGSHTKIHPNKIFKKQKKYNSKAMSKSYIRNFDLVRPTLKPGKAVIHHPNIIHGNSINKGNQTRVSIEIRLFNKFDLQKKKVFDQKYYY